MTEIQEERVMRIAQVAEYCTVSTQTIRNWLRPESTVSFPNGTKISPKITLWKKSEIDKFLSNKTN